MADPIILTEQHFAKVQKELERAMGAANRRVAQLILEEMKDLTSMEDHTPEDLRKLGYPYRRDAPADHPHKDFRVHRQSGDLHDGLEIEQGQPGGVIISDGIVSHAPHTMHVILGTRSMRPRDFVTEAIDQTQDQVDAIYDQALKTTLAKFSG